MSEIALYAEGSDDVMYLESCCLYLGKILRTSVHLNEVRIVLTAFLGL